MNIIIFGTGKIYERYRGAFESKNVVVFLDNNVNKQGNLLDGVQIVSPERVNEYAYDYVILACVKYHDMRNQLISYGVPEDKIIDKDHRGIFEEIRCIKRYHNTMNDDLKKRVVLVSHHMGLTGAPLVLLKAATMLSKNGYDVELYADRYGELIDKALEAGISVSVFVDFDFTDSEVEQYFSNFDMIFVNTVTLYNLIKKLGKTSKPVIWWLHEEDDVYKRYSLSAESLDINENVHVYGVGKRAIDSFRKYSHDKKIKELPYGIEEKKISSAANKEKIVFAIIGTVDKRKAQNVLVEAVFQNKDRWFGQAEFWIIGNITETLRAKYEIPGLVKVWGVLEHEKMLELYSQIDVVVCPSRNDPLPVVVTEGMMNEKVCIVSDMTGSADYIIPYESGLICKAGDVDSLVQCITWALNNKQEMKRIGENAYQIYKNHFSMEHFEKNILEVVENL